MNLQSPNLETWLDNQDESEDFGPISGPLKILDNMVISNPQINNMVDLVFTDEDKPMKDVVNELNAIIAELDNQGKQQTATATATATSSLLKVEWFIAWMKAHPQARIKGVAERIEDHLTHYSPESREQIFAQLKTVCESGSDEKQVQEFFLAVLSRLEKNAPNNVSPTRQQQKPASNGRSHKGVSLKMPAVLTRKAGPLQIWMYGGMLVLIIVLMAVGMLFFLPTSEPPAQGELPGEQSFAFITPYPEVTEPPEETVMEEPVPEEISALPAEGVYTEPEMEEPPTAEEDFRAQYEVWSAQATSLAAENRGYAGPDKAYAKIGPSLDPGIYYNIVEYSPDPSWIIVLPRAGGQPAFYPREVVGELMGDPQTDEVQLMALESVDRLYDTLRLSSIAGRQTSPIVIFMIGVLGLLGLVFILIEAIGRDEMGDAIHAYLVTAIMAVGAVAISTEAYMKIAVGIFHVGTTNAVPVDPLILQNLQKSYSSGIATWITIVIAIWVVWVAISPIRALVYDEVEDDNILKWFPKFDLSPIANIFYLVGTLSVLGILTTPAIAWGVKPAERVTNIAGFFAGVAANATPSLTSFAMFCLTASVLIYIAENIRTKQFMASIFGVSLSGVHFLIRHFAPTWHPVFPLIIAIGFTAGIFALLYALKSTRHMTSTLKWGGIMQTVVAVATLLLLSFGTY